MALQSWGREQWGSITHQLTLHKTVYDTESIVSSWRILSVSRLRPLFLGHLTAYFYVAKDEKHPENMQWSFGLNSLLRLLCIIPQQIMTLNK